LLDKLESITSEVGTSRLSTGIKQHNYEFTKGYSKDNSVVEVRV
jgi:hypothetical protein